MKEYLKGTTRLAVFLKITALDGSVFRVWNGTRNKIVPSDGTYLAYPLAPSRLQQSAGLKADNLEIAATYFSSFNAQTLRARKWEGARVEYAVYNYRDFSIGYAERRVGFIGRTETGKFAAKPEMVSLSSKLNQPVGRTYNAECDVAELGELRCRVDLNGWTADGYRIRTTATVSTVSNRQQFTVSFAEAMKRGLRARYYAGENFDTLIRERVDQTIDFDYGQSAPFPGMPTDHWSGRWEGTITFPYSETFTLSVEHDDGIRLWVNNLATPLIDQWSALGTHSAAFAATAGTAYDLKLEFKEEVSVSKIKFRWQSASQALQIIPATAFTPPADTGTVYDNIYHRGKAEFLTGANAGVEAQILANTAGALTLYLPLFYTPSPGDSVQLTVGCDRKIATCRDRFANGINFQGFFTIPGRSKVFKIPEN